MRVGGRFDTATAFFEAWADNGKFRWYKQEIKYTIQRSDLSRIDDYVSRELPVTDRSDS